VVLRIIRWNMMRDQSTSTFQKFENFKWLYGFIRPSS